MVLNEYWGFYCGVDEESSLSGYDAVQFGM